MADAPTAGDGVASTPSDWAARNHQARMDTLEWALTKPGPRLLVLTSAMIPGVTAFDQILKAGSAAQLRREMMKLIQGGPQPSLRLLMTSRTASTQPFFDAMKRQLFGSDFWEVLEGTERTLAAASVSFAIMGRVATGFHWHFTTRPTTYPWKLFRLVQEPQLASEIVVDTSTYM